MDTLLRPSAWPGGPWGAVRKDAVPEGIWQKLAFLMGLYRTPLDRPVEVQDPRPHDFPSRDDEEDGDGDIKEEGK